WWLYSAGALVGAGTGARTGVKSKELIGVFNASHEFVFRVPRVKCTLIPGSARVSRGESVPLSRTFRGRLFRRDAETKTRDACATRLIALDQSDTNKVRPCPTQTPYNFRE